MCVASTALKKFACVQCPCESWNSMSRSILGAPKMCAPTTLDSGCTKHLFSAFVNWLNQKIEEPSILECYCVTWLRQLCDKFMEIAGNISERIVNSPYIFRACPYKDIILMAQFLENTLVGEWFPDLPVHFRIARTTTWGCGLMSRCDIVEF